jgi:hypothetical protein
MHGDEVIAPQNELHFAGAGNALHGVPNGKVHDDEQIILALIQFGAFGATEQVFQMQGVDFGVGATQLLHIFTVGRDDVYPGKTCTTQFANWHNTVLAGIIHTHLIIVQRGLFSNGDE